MPSSPLPTTLPPKSALHPSYSIFLHSTCSVFVFFNLLFPGVTSGKEPTANAGDIRDEGLIPGPGRSPGGGHGNPLQYSRLETPMDRGAWWATVQGFTKSQTRLSN